MEREPTSFPQSSPLPMSSWEKATYILYFAYLIHLSFFLGPIAIKLAILVGILLETIRSAFFFLSVKYWGWFSSFMIIWFSGLLSKGDIVLLLSHFLSREEKDMRMSDQLLPLAMPLLEPRYNFLLPAINKRSQVEVEGEGQVWTGNIHQSTISFF